VELKGDPGQPFAVENLAGTMRVRAGSGSSVVAVATIHAESAELADAVRFEQVTADKGIPALRVRYALDRGTIRYPGAAREGGGWLDGLFGGGNRVRYDGREVGVLVYADVEVELPRSAVAGTFRQVVGPLEGQDVEGTLRFDTGGGAITLHQVSGEVVGDTGSGTVTAGELRGSFRCDTGSGNCAISGFEGDRLACDTGSGDVRARAIAARKVVMDTGSGTVELLDADVEEFVADTGSGDVLLENRGARLSRVKADTGSGDVVIRMGADAAFEARADTGSGEVVSRYGDGEPIVRDREVVGYRRGDGRVRIFAETGSGSLVLEPLP
jgi:hypothetical protein